MPDYQFSTDWLSESLKYFNMIMRSFDPRRILEIGSFEGRSATYFIDKINGKEGAHLTCIDPWVDYWEMGVLMNVAEEKFDRNTKLALEGSNVDFHKLKGPSIKRLCQLIVEDEPQFDLIYVDGSHTAVDVFADAALSFHLLKPQGVLIFDDYAALPPAYAGGVEIQDYPRPAVDAFIHAHGNRLAPIMFGVEGNSSRSFGGIGATYQCYLRKTR
jgi:predicted O-methyltransferase YrrM